MKYEKSCGVIAYRWQQGEPYVLVICHRYGDHWAFPKGHMEPGEAECETALRETREETGAAVTLVRGYREVTTYSPAHGVTKDVVLFVGRLGTGPLRAQPEEVREVRVLPYQAAYNILTYDADKALLEKARPFLVCP